MESLANALEKLREWETYKKFIKEHNDYYLAHGFIQLTGQYQKKDAWQIGFYSSKNDNLAVFTTEPLKQLPFEEAFKESGIIEELPEPKTLIDFDKATGILRHLMGDEYSKEVVSSFIIILQVLKGEIIYNITAVTQSLSMIIIKMDARDGNIIEHEQRSLMDLKKKDDYSLLSPDLANGVISELLAENKTGISERDLLIETGRRVQAYAVMAGYLFRFRERIGKRYAVESPASVAFDFHLIRVSDGSILWGGSYDETQRALSENVLHIGTFLTRKGQWIKADKMAKEGLNKILKTFQTVHGD